MRLSTLQRIEGLTDEKAQLIRDIISDEVDPCEVSEAADRWERWCFHRPSDLALQLCAIDDVLGTHGVECIDYRDGRDTWNGPRFSYCNTGDSYAATVCYDHGRGRWVVCGWADLVGG